VVSRRAFRAISFRSLSLATVVSAASLCLSAAPAGAASVTRSLAANIPIGALPQTCNRAPDGDVCLNAVVVALDTARADIGLGPYVLPADFNSLSGTEQILILSNLDRIAYGLPPITGLSTTLASATQSAMRSDVDPDPTPLLDGLSVYGWTSNWAGDWANAPYAYYEWMYDDGYDGAETSNIDCTSSAANGCWVHRRNVLAFSSAGTLALGAAVGTDASGNSSYATTLVWTPRTNWTSYSFTWAQAKAEGAGAAHNGRLARHRLADARHRRHHESH
jgi:hypothetical protein